MNKPRTIRCTKVLAVEFAEMDPAPHDRPLSERRLGVYRRLLKEGSFRPVTWAKAFCKETNGVYRVNGKHTSVLLASTDPMPEFYVVVEEYICDTLEDVAKLYSTFDSTIQSRSANDIYMSFAATIPELVGCSQCAITRGAAAMAYYTWGADYNMSHQPAERAEFLLETPEFVLWINRIFSGSTEGGAASRHIQRVAVIAAMYGSWVKSQKAATEFWTLVRDETSPVPEAPDRKLARYLLTTGINTGNGSRSRARKADTREVYVKCIHAWNAWRKGETTRLNYHPEADVPSFR